MKPPSFQGGVGTAGSANIGKRYAMFEAIHGSAPRMVREGRAQYADPSSMVRAGAMMLSHIGYPELGERLGKALDLCGQYEAKLVMTGRDTGATSRDFGDYILETVQAPDLADRWAAAVNSATAAGPLAPRLRAAVSLASGATAGQRECGAPCPLGSSP